MNKIFVILDSMVIMEYKFFEEYPWQAHEQLQGKRVHLVFTRPLLEELNRNKDFHQRGGVRKRCRNAISWITKNLGGSKGEPYRISENLFAVLDLSNYPHHSQKLVDDRLIEYASEREPVAVLTKDAMVTLLAMDAGIETILPLEAAREANLEQTEVEQLQSEIAVYKNLRPSVSIGSRVSGGFTTGYESHIDQIITKALSQQKDRFPKPKHDIFGAPDPIYIMLGSKDQYLKQLESRLQECRELACALLAAPFVALEIRNEGSAPGTQIEVSISSPEGTSIVEEDQIAFPRMPTNPLDRSFGIGADLVDLEFLHGDRPRPSKTLELDRKSLLQSKVWKIPRFFVVSNGDFKHSDFGISVQVVTSELPKPVSTTIKVNTTEFDRDSEKFNIVMSKLTEHFT